MAAGVLVTIGSCIDCSTSHAPLRPRLPRNNYKKILASSLRNNNDAPPSASATRCVFRTHKIRPHERESHCIFLFVKSTASTQFYLFGLVSDHASRSCYPPRDTHTPTLSRDSLPCLAALSILIHFRLPRSGSRCHFTINCFARPTVPIKSSRITAFPREAVRQADSSPARGVISV